jgi:hypothetical protein
VSFGKRIMIAPLTEQAGPIGRSQHLFLVALLASARATVTPFMGTKPREVISLKAAHSCGGRVSPLSISIPFGSIRCFSEGT